MGLFVEEAAHGVTVADGAQGRSFPVALPRHEVRTARMEGAPRGPVVRMRHRAGDGREALPRARAYPRNRAKESFRVGMAWRVKDVVHGSLLDHAPQPH